MKYINSLAEKSIEEISLLKDNWNENGAKPFSKELVQRAKNYLDTCHGEPEIFPTARGSIQFEWDFFFGHFEAEIYEDRTEYFLELNNGREIEWCKPCKSSG